MCQRESDVERERQRDRSAGLALSAQCTITGVRLVQRALWRYITRSFSNSTFVFLFSVFDSNAARLCLTCEEKEGTEKTITKSKKNKRSMGIHQATRTTYLPVNQTL